MWLNDSACNLASINLYKFAKGYKEFDINTFKHVVRLLVTAQDIIVDMAGYPTEEIRKNSSDYRPLGLGFANLGGLLMAWGLPYDSDAGRALAANITSLMTAQAYHSSMELSQAVGPFRKYQDNTGPMEGVLAQHYRDSRDTPKDIEGIQTKAVSIWQEVLGIGCGRRKRVDAPAGFRNCQVTLIAPTGTIAFMMDCDTTGIEPDVGLKKYKKLVGGGELVYSNSLVRSALENLDYDQDTIEEIEDHISEYGHVEGSPLHDSDLSIFDCALAAEHEVLPGTRTVPVEGHIKMIAAVQPFLSGAVSKTFNMPHSATVQDIERTFLQAWESGLKCIAVYRDGSKMSAPLRVQEAQEKASKKNAPVRNKPPTDLPSRRHKFSVGGSEGFIHTGHHPDTDELIEVFIRMANPGATVNGLLDNYFILFSKSLQYGIPLEVLLSHMEGTKFAPAGPTPNREIHMATSVLDYIAKYLRKEYLGEKKEGLKIISVAPDALEDKPVGIFDINADPCPECGELLRKSGSCYFCGNCAYSSGVCS
jgi:ribonucleoside-diphosphate reductase alpha chain